jgi:hypothetical protein
MKETGERAKAGDNAGAHRGQKRSPDGTTTLSDLKITRDQSSKWPQLAGQGLKKGSPAKGVCGPSSKNQTITLVGNSLA